MPAAVFDNISFSLGGLKDLNMADLTHLVVYTEDSKEGTFKRTTEKRSGLQL